MAVEALYNERKPDVLVVDDDSAIRESVRDVLQLEGYHVVTAENGEDALSKTSGNKPRVILLDVSMPVMNGWEFREAQLQDPNIRDIPVLVFCAGNKNDARPPGITAAGFLSKPIDIDDLLQAIRPFTVC